MNSEHVQLPTYADNVALPAFARRCCSNRSISPALHSKSSFVAIVLTRTSFLLNCWLPHVTATDIVYILYFCMCQMTNLTFLRVSLVVSLCLFTHINNVTNKQTTKHSKSSNIRQTPDTLELQLLAYCIGFRFCILVMPASVATEMRLRPTNSTL